MEEAEALLSLPRELGADPADGEAIVANNGRYGPYVQKGKDFRSLDNEEQLLTITLEEALRILAQPKVYRRGGRNAAPKGPLREFGTDPVSERPVVARDGRFGVYVTDGETNASIGKGDRIEEMVPERAYELLAVRREQVAAKGGDGPAKRTTRSQAPGQEDARRRSVDHVRRGAAVRRPRRGGGMRQEHPGRDAGRRAGRRADPRDRRDRRRPAAPRDPPRRPGRRPRRPRRGADHRRRPGPARRPDRPPRARGRAVRGERPQRLLDARLPGLRTRARHRRAAPDQRLGDRGSLAVARRAPRRRRPTSSPLGCTAASSTASSGRARSSTTGSSTGTARWRAPTPTAGSSWLPTASRTRSPPVSSRRSRSGPRRERAARAGERLGRRRRAAHGGGRAAALGRHAGARLPARRTARFDQGRGGQGVRRRPSDRWRRSRQPGRPPGPRRRASRRARDRSGRARSSPPTRPERSCGWRRWRRSRAAAR